MRRTQILVVELRPGADLPREGMLISDPNGGPFDVLGWVIAAQEPMEET